MEQNSPVATNKVWSLVRLIFFIIRKTMSKTKLLLDLNLMIKRGKLAGKTLQNLILHHHHHRHPPNFTFPPPPTEDYEFSPQNKSTCINDDDRDGIFVDPAVLKALEMLIASPRFGKSPVVRQLRITDSPFALTNGEEDSYVDEAAEKFLIKFYNDLRRQS